MFGFSLPKLIFTIVAVLAVWHGFKWFARYQEDRFSDRDRVRRRSPTAPPHARAREPEIESEEMVKCPLCETYVSAKSAVSCGRDGCPYPG